MEAPIHIEPKYKGTLVLQTSSELIFFLFEAFVLAKIVPDSSLVATFIWLSIESCDVIRPITLGTDTFAIQGFDSISY